MSADFLGDDLARYVAKTIDADPSFKGALEDAAEARRLVDSLIAARRQRGLSQVEIARRMGVRQPTVSGFEKEPSDPKLSTLQRYARALDTRLRLVLETSSTSGSSPWGRRTTYAGSSRESNVHKSTEKLDLTKWDRPASGVLPNLKQARVA